MNRVARYKAGYVVVILCLAVPCVGALYLANWSLVAVIALVLILLVPGRVQGILLRDLFRGRRELDRGNPSTALTDLERFLATLESQPWRRHALWLSWSVYTPSVRAMALNDIGAAHLALGAADRAAKAWRDALEIDPLYPLPHANLALVAAANGDSPAAERFVASAKSLGYSGGALDRTIQRVQSLLATVEGRGSSHSPTDMRGTR